MSRPRGGYIGFNRVPAAAGSNSAARGVWTLREAEAERRAGTWPIGAPGGVGAGLQLWLDAADPSTLFDATTGGSLVAAGGGVSRWQDKSVNARHATQATSANRPLRKTAIQGGKDVLRFDGSNDLLSIASSTATFKFLHGENATVFLVGKAGIINNPEAIYCFLATHDRDSNIVGYSLLFDDRNLPNDSYSANNQVKITVGENVIETRDRGNSGFTANTFKVLSAITRPTEGVAADRVAVRVNGGASVSGNNDTGARSTGNATNNLTIGSIGTGGDYFTGDIAEIIIYDSALSDTNRASVESYLMSKWGIT